MPSCHDMKLGEVYVCEHCELELKVVKTCKDCGESIEDCECPEHCSFSCCGEEMKLKA